MVGVDQASLSAVVGRRFAEQPEQWTWGSDAARDELRAELSAWQAAGTPSLDALCVRVYPLATAPAPATGATAVDTRWWRIVIADRVQRK